MRSVRVLVFALVACAALPAEAATINGVISDVTGAALSGARVVIRDVATGQESFVETDGEGRYRLDAPALGAYLVIVSRAGFSQSARTVVIDTIEIQGIAGDASDPLGPIN